MLHAVYNFTGRVNEVMKRICGLSRHYHPWFKRYPLVCTQENCTAEFDSTTDFTNHLQQNHPNILKPSSFMQFRCSVCDLPITNAEKEIRAHLKTQQLSMTRYAFLRLTNTKNLFTAPSKDYWTLAEGDNLFINLQNSPPSSTQPQSTPTSAKNPVRVNPTSTTNPPGSERNTSPSDPLNDFLSAQKDETMESNYENDQEFECLFDNPVLPLNNPDTFNGGTSPPIPAPSSSAPPAGPGLWGHTPSNDPPATNILNGTLPGPYPDPGPNPGTIVHSHAPPIMSQSARVPGQMEQNLTNATISGPPPNVVTNQVGPPFNFVGSANTNPVSYPAFQILHTPVSSLTPTSTVPPQFIINPEPVSSTVPATSVPPTFDHGRNPGLTIPSLPIPSTNLASAQHAQWAKVNGVFTQIPIHHQPISYSFGSTPGLTTVTTNTHQLTAGHPPFMTYGLVNPIHHTQGNSLPLGLATASAPSVASAITSTLPVGPPLTVPSTVYHPSLGAKETSHPPEPLVSSFEDPAIVRVSAHFTKPMTQSSKLIPKSPYNYEPRTTTNPPNIKPTAATVKSSSTYGVKEDDVLSLCCSSDLESTQDDYTVPPADKLPPPPIHEDISLELAEKKKATYFSDYPIINKVTSESHGLKVHQARTSPLDRVTDLDPEFESMYQRIQDEVKQIEDDKKPSILAYVSPLESTYSTISP